MKKILFIFAILSLVGCTSKEMAKVRQLDIQNVNLTNIPDGNYIGSFSYSGFEYTVKTNVKTHQITDIEVLQNRDTEHARRAEGVLNEIINSQTPNVDAISGATTTSKALMKAVENSLQYKQ